MLWAAISQRQIFPYLVNDPSVVVYFADVPLALPHGLNAALYDLSLVQVLKGPQGTLFGRNSTGGADDGNLRSLAGSERRIHIENGSGGTRLGRPDTGGRTPFVSRLSVQAVRKDTNVQVLASLPVH